MLFVNYSLLKTQNVQVQNELRSKKKNLTRTFYHLSRSPESSGDDRYDRL